MPSASLEREILRFDPSIPIERAWMPPSSWYVDPELHAFELQHVLARSWQPVARRVEVASPGSFKSGLLPGILPWLVVRDADGTLRAFHNACRHKGREVMQGEGVCAALVCGYHAWTYALDGSLRTAPRMAGVQDFDRARMSLAPMAVAEWGPWVFVHPDPEAALPGPPLAPLHALLEATGWGDLVFHARTSWTLECNWKVYVDNYLDGGYHIPHMHPSLDAQLDMSSYRTELFETFSVQSSRPTEVPDGRLAFDARERIGSGALYAWIYPNFMLNRYGPVLDSNLVLPRGPDRCEVLYEFFVRDDPSAASRAFLEASMEQSAVTQREDIAICESVQVGLHSPAYDRGRYAPRLEIGEHHFHGLLARALRAALDQRSIST